LGHALGLASEERFEKMNNKKSETAKLVNDLKQKKFSPDAINAGLERLETATITEKISAEKLLKRPQLGIKELVTLSDELAEYLTRYPNEVIEQAEIQIKYESYLEKEQLMVEKLANMEDFKITPTFDYLSITALSNEGRQKLHKIRPETLGQASRISGVSPADLSILTVYLGR
jgi:tRNA uridine 5-carboxymethylaminomethyl modification enzyme